jgi:hypothetical protein
MLVTYTNIKTIECSRSPSLDYLWWNDVTVVVIVLQCSTHGPPAYLGHVRNVAVAGNSLLDCRKQLFLPWVNVSINHCGQDVKVCVVWTVLRLQLDICMTSVTSAVQPELSGSTSSGFAVA